MSAINTPAAASRFRVLAERFHAAHASRPEQARALLVRLGTHNPDGTLSPAYGGKPMTREGAYLAAPIDAAGCIDFAAVRGPYEGD